LQGSQLRTVVVAMGVTAAAIMILPVAVALWLLTQIL